MTHSSDEKEAIVIQGRVLPQTEPHCHASFLIGIRLSREYPFKAPEVAMLDPIYHPRVITPDKCCCCWDFLYPELYKPITPLVDIVKAVIRAIDNIADPSHCINDECDEGYRNDYQTFYEKALRSTFSYGRPRY